MSNNRLYFEGLDELREALRQLPEELTAEAGDIVIETATDATSEVVTIYERHSVSSHLARSVKTGKQERSGYGVQAIIRVNSPIAWLFDNGSQARHWASGKSTGEMWGRSAPTHAFSGTMARKRRQMYERLKALLVEHGLLVSGDA